MQNTFGQHVSNYGCAFLNSGGGSLVVGVNDDGMVCGLYFSHEEEDKTRLQVDGIVKLLHPPLLPHNYSLRFLPVVKPGVEEHRLKVLCLTFRAPPAFSEPTLYQNDHGKVYIRRDGSIEGPLGNSVILEWSRQVRKSMIIIVIIIKIHICIKMTNMTISSADMLCVCFQGVEWKGGASGAVPG